MARIGRHVSPQNHKAPEQGLETLQLKEELAQTKRRLLSVIEAQASAGEGALSDQEEAQSNIEREVRDWLEAAMSAARPPKRARASA